MGNFLKRGLFVSILLCALLMITGCGDTSKKLSKKVRKKTDKIMQAIVEKDRAYLKSELCEIIRSRKSGNVDEDVEALINAIEDIEKYSFDSYGAENYACTYGKVTKYRTVIDYKVYTKSKQVYTVSISYCLVDVEEQGYEGIEIIIIKNPDKTYVKPISCYKE